MNRLHVLLVDDSTELLSVLGAALTQDGFAVVCANNGADALCLLSGTRPPDVVILDLIMPRMDGHDVLRKLGPTAPPVILITGGPVAPEDLNCPKVKRVIAKPFDYSDIRKAIKDVLTCPPPQSDAETLEEIAPGVLMNQADREKAQERIARYEAARATATAPGESP